MTIGALQHPAAPAANGTSPLERLHGLPLNQFTQNNLDIHPALEEVRRLPEFQPPPPSPLDALLKQPWFQKLYDAAGQALEAALKGIVNFLGKAQPHWMPDLPQNIRDLFSIFISFILVLAGLYGVYLLLTLLIRWQEGRQISNQKAADRFFEESLLTTSEHHYRNAFQAAQNGDYQNAIRELYMASLCLLDEKSVVPYESARTNLEYQRQLSAQAREDLKQDFHAMAQTFEGIRYGKQHAGAAQFQSSHTRFEALQTHLKVPHG
ncbi:DUF4129 domain-containing protein [Vampirovibrio chlorellavorus]|uniref:DUF4129 domain-containing protein n=1 Tax=Vampirovibrio chlorellavorus TaxID=758823 RepID=UPI0026EC2E2F|nr:DUF4129 domain-containing protein [Vampirovibrio chlorellavorus]